MIPHPVSYLHLAPPTKGIVVECGVAVFLQKKKERTNRRERGMQGMIGCIVVNGIGLDVRKRV